MLTTNLILFVNLKSLFLQTPKDNLAYKLTSWLNSCPVLKKTLFASHNTDSNISIYAQLQFGERFKVKLHSYGRSTVFGHVNQPLDTKMRLGEEVLTPHFLARSPGDQKSQTLIKAEHSQSFTGHILPLRQVRLRRWQNEEVRFGARTRARGAGAWDKDEEVSSLPPLPPTGVHWPWLKRLRQPELQKERTVPGPQHAPLFIPPRYRPAAPLSLLSTPHTLAYTYATNFRCTGSMPDYYISWLSAGRSGHTAESSHPASHMGAHAHGLAVILQRSKPFSLEPAQL